MSEFDHRAALVQALLEHEHLDPRNYDSSSTLMSGGSGNDNPSVVANAQDGLLTKGELGRYLKQVFGIEMRETKKIYDNLLRTNLKHKSQIKVGLGTTELFDAMLEEVFKTGKSTLSAEDLKGVVATVLGIKTQ